MAPGTPAMLLALLLPLDILVGLSHKDTSIREKREVEKCTKTQLETLETDEHS